MGGGACVVIIEGNTVQGDSQLLISTASASCQLVDYLRTEDNWNEDDAKPIEDFHVRAKAVVSRLNADLDAINRALAAKYKRAVS